MDRIIEVKGTNFVIMPSLGQIRSGHLLICPNEHVEAFSDLPEKDMEHVFKIMDKVKGFYQSFAFSDTIFFEHGCSTTRGIFGAASITHAHLHALPFMEHEDEDLMAELRNDDNNIIQPIQHFRELKTAFEKHASYVLYVNTKGEMFMILAKKEWESQYMRKISGKIVGNEDYDWKGKNEVEEDVIVTAQLLKFSSNHFVI